MNQNRSGFALIPSLTLLAFIAMYLFSCWRELSFTTDIVLLQKELMEQQQLVEKTFDEELVAIAKNFMLHRTIIKKNHPVRYQKNITKEKLLAIEITPLSQTLHVQASYVENRQTKLQVSSLLEQKDHYDKKLCMVRCYTIHHPLH